MSDSINTKTMVFLIKDRLNLSIHKLYEFICNEYSNSNILLEKEKNTYLIIKTDIDIKPIIRNYILTEIANSISISEEIPADMNLIETIQHNLDIFYEITVDGQSVLIENATF